MIHVYIKKYIYNTDKTLHKIRSFTEKGNTKNCEKFGNLVPNESLQ